MFVFLYYIRHSLKALVDETDIGFLPGNVGRCHRRPSWAYELFSGVLSWL